MKATELQIGDWVSIKPLSAYIYTRHKIKIQDFANLHKMDFVPIPLTHLILEKNGWKETQYWHEYQDSKNTIQCCLPDMRGRINGIEIVNFKCEFVHQYQHLLRLCGLDELADNFKI